MTVITTDRPHPAPSGFYVYGHYLPDGTIKYIGKGQGHRAWDFTHRSKVWKNYANKYGFSVKILDENITEESAFELETFAIDFFGRVEKQTGPLINLTDGGDGASGAVRTDETKEKIRQAKLAYHPLRGKKRPDWWARSKGAAGREILQSTRDKLSKANKGKKRTQEQKDALSKALIGKRIGSDNGRARPVINLDTGRIFGAASLAIEYVEKTYGISFTKASLCEAMKAGKRCKGFLFGYVDKQ